MKADVHYICLSSKAPAFMTKTACAVAAMGTEGKTVKFPILSDDTGLGIAGMAWSHGRRNFYQVGKCERKTHRVSMLRRLN